jgi:vacuolar-type H+-ATPase subunit D/Vma8
MNDNELREAIENAVAKPIEAVAESGWPIEEFKEAIDAILDLITAERKKWELKARIEELQRQINNFEWDNGTDKMDTRVTDLTNQLNNLKEK